MLSFTIPGMETTAHFTCPVTLKREFGRSIISIQSPRTGKVIRFNDGWRPGLGRIWSRVIVAVANGRHAADFTAEELRRVVDLVTPRAIAMHSKPVPECRSSVAM